MPNKTNICVGITGASGAVYARRLVEVLLAAGCDVHLSISPSGAQVIDEELGVKLDLQKFQPTDLQLEDAGPGKLHYHHFQNFNAPIASGSFLTGGMVVCPCSGTTLSAIAHSSASNLIQRAAEVHLKERRKLIVVPRETPLSLPQIENMRLATQAGVVVMPASPGWYHGVTKLEDLVDFMVARVCDQLGVDCELIRRWGQG